MPKCNQPTKSGTPCQHTVTSASGCGADHSAPTTPVTASAPSGTAVAVADPLAGIDTGQFIASKRQAIRTMAVGTAPLVHTRHLSYIQQQGVATSGWGTAQEIATAIRQMRTDDPTGSHHIDKPSMPPIPDSLTGRAAMAKAATHLLKAQRGIESAQRLLSLDPDLRETALMRAEGRARAAAVLYQRAAEDLKVEIVNGNVAAPTVEQAHTGASRALMAARGQSLASPTRRGAANGALWAAVMHLRNIIDGLGAEPDDMPDTPLPATKDEAVTAASALMDGAAGQLDGFADDTDDGRWLRARTARTALHHARELLRHADEL